MKDEFLRHVLKNKMPFESEIELHLFDFCNLRCLFCGQDHDSKVGMNEITSKVPLVCEFIKNNSSKGHILNIMGGELFNDEVPDNIFTQYRALVLEIDRFSKSIGHTCHFNWVTNLIFKKHERVSALLTDLREQGVSVKISTSYDFAGRKNKIWIHDIFRKNLERYKGDVYTVGFVLTKPAIEFLLEGHDDYFEYLYQNYPLYFDYYVPEQGAKILMPSDQEILDAFRFIAKNYPKINPVKDLLENDLNRMTCYSLNKITLLPDNREVKCRYLKYDEGVFKNKVDYQSNDNIILSHLEENQCLSCEWFDRCGFRCFVQADWSERKRLETCLFKSFYQEFPVGGVVGPHN